MTALEYMEKQLQKHTDNWHREAERNAPDEVMDNIEKKISYYEQAVEALRMEYILLNESGDAEV